MVNSNSLPIAIPIPETQSEVWQCVGHSNEPYPKDTINNNNPGIVSANVVAGGDIAVDRLFNNYTNAIKYVECQG